MGMGGGVGGGGAAPAREQVSSYWQYYAQLFTTDSVLRFAHSIQPELMI